MPVALPALGDIAAFLMLLLIAAALWVIIQLLVNSIGKAPVIGSWVSNTLAGWLNDARNAILKAASATWHAGIQLFKWMEAYFVGQYDLAFRLLEDAGGAVYRIAYVRIPAALAAAENYGLSVYHAAIATADSLYNRAIAYAAQVRTETEAHIVSVRNSIVSYSAGLFIRAEANAIALTDRIAAALASDITSASTTLRADLTGLDRQLSGDISALDHATQLAVNQLASDITARVSSAEALAASQLAAVRAGIYTDLDTWGRQAVADAWPDAAGDIGALRGTLGADFPWLNDLLGAMGGLGTAGILGALIRSLAGAHAVTRLANDCIVPNCRNLSGLGRDLAGLSQLFADGTLFAWLAEGATNPAGWASDLDAVMGPVGNATVATARNVFGGR